jgi:hypothetical protein
MSICPWRFDVRVIRGGGPGELTHEALATYVVNYVACGLCRAVWPT